MLRVTIDSTSAARARSLNVRRSPRWENFFPNPIASATSANGLLSTDGERNPPSTEGKSRSESACAGVRSCVSTCHLRTSKEMLGLRRGYTVADASNLFDTSFRNEDLIECGCNMHARRYCCKALDAGDSRAAIPIAAYKRLYEIEAEIRDCTPPDKLAARIAQSKPVFDGLVAWCKTCHPLEPPSSLLGKAMRYILNHHVALGRFLESGDVPIDNGIVERLHVRAALTRKAYLFAGSDSGGERAAIAYTILACCLLAGVDPVQYLSDVLPRMARRIRIVDLPALLPARWKLAHSPPDAGGST